MEGGFMFSGLSRRARNLSPSPTLALDARTKELQAKGVDVVNLGIGEPDFDTPSHIGDAAVQAIREGFTKYTPATGIPDLKKAVCKKFLEDNGLEYDLSQVVISVGAKQAVYNAVQVLCDEGDEVIVPAPYWVSYTEIIKLAGGIPVEVPSREEAGFKVSAADLEAAIGDRTKILLFNSPNNPSGAVYDRDELLAIADVCLKRGLYIISDEIYEKLVYGGLKHVSIASVRPALKDRTIVINGVSKAFSMTGWRIGFAAGPREAIKAMGDLQGQVTSNPTSISQKAALAALLGPKEPVEAMVREFEKRRNFVVGELNSIPGLRCSTPGGAFYVYPNVSAFIGKKNASGKTIADSADLAEAILQEAAVAVVPGTAFGMDGYVRISYATSMENLRKGIDRLRRFFAALG
ncbi:MAG: pyridoxal phosphate-dependent aminotransferase [Firmicutes bacterium]|jgi:aspartate aminotransferase|nr:pyridoxal phosphate-dependent aminotransferase [Bacillota bacterium]